MLRLYRRYVQPYSGAEISHIQSYGPRSEEATRRSLLSADMVALQVQDFGGKADKIVFPEGLPVHRFPVVAGNFLWPFTGRERPGNQPMFGLGAGPFPGQMGDSYLNRLILAGRDIQLAASEYTALDVSTVVDLDRMFQIVMSKQRRLDQELGYGVESLMNEHLRSEPLFRTSLHPTARIVVHLAVTLFRKMGVDEAILNRIERLQKNPGLPPPECPIHPSIARHFGLNYINETTTYRFLNEGRYTFSEWVTRYLAGDWNQTLAEGMDYRRKKRPFDATQELLERGLALSPGSGPGWGALSATLIGQGRMQEAISAARKAVECEPDEATSHAHLSGLLFQSGDAQGAAQSCRAAFDLDPAAIQIRRRVPYALMKAGAFVDALKFVQDQIADPVEPPTSELYALLARLLERTGEHSEALRIGALAADMSPVHRLALTTYSGLLSAAGRHEEAATFMRQAVEMTPDSAEAWFALSRNCVARDKDDEACTAIQHAIRLDDGKFPYHSLHASILVRLQRFHDAQAAYDAALALRPDDPTLLALGTVIQHRIASLDPRPRVMPTATDAALPPSP